MPTAVQPRRRSSASSASAAAGKRCWTSASARSITGARMSAMLFGLPRQLRADLADPLPRNPEAIADLGQRVLPPVAPAVIADQDLRVAVARSRGENLDQFFFQRQLRHPRDPLGKLLDLLGHVGRVGRVLRPRQEPLGQLPGRAAPPRPPRACSGQIAGRRSGPARRRAGRPGRAAAAVNSSDSAGRGPAPRPAVPPLRRRRRRGDSNALSRSTRHRGPNARIDMISPIVWSPSGCGRSSKPSRTRQRRVRFSNRKAGQIGPLGGRGKWRCWNDLANVIGRDPIDHHLGQLHDHLRRQPLPDRLVQVAEFQVAHCPVFPRNSCGDRLHEELAERVRRHALPRDVDSDLCLGRDHRKGLETREVARSPIITRKRNKKRGWWKK